MIKHYVEYRNANYIFKAVKILIVLYRKLYTNVKGTRRYLASKTPPYTSDIDCGQIKSWVKYGISLPHEEDLLHTW